jgi:hypothetical protein
MTWNAGTDVSLIASWYSAPELHVAVLLPGVRGVTLTIVKSFEDGDAYDVEITDYH